MAENGTTDQTNERGVRGRPDPNLTDVPTRDLLRGIVSDAGDLVRKEITLAKAELRANLHTSVMMAKGMLAATILALVGLTLVFVTIIFAIAHVLPGWLAALVVTGCVLLAAGIAFALAWAKRIKQPLAQTRAQIKEDVRWAKERLT